MGIDPGTRIVGYAILEAPSPRLGGAGQAEFYQGSTGSVYSANGGDSKVVTYGVIRASLKEPLALRLKTIYQGLTKVLRKYRPDEVVIENVFYSKDAQATIKIGEGRGVALLCAANQNCTIYEYTPAEIKKSVTGNGRAHKTQIQEMVKLILGLAEIPKPADAADALAMAICHIHRYR